MTDLTHPPIEAHVLKQTFDNHSSGNILDGMTATFKAAAMTVEFGGQSIDMKTQAPVTNAEANVNAPPSLNNATLG